MRQIEHKEAYAIVTKYLENQVDILNLKNFRKMKRFKNRKVENFYKFTVDLLCLDLVFDLNSDDRVKNVYWSASMPPPGAGIDGVSMRFKIYIQYTGEE